MQKDEKNVDLLSLTTEIVSAHVSNNHVEVEALPQLIRQVYSALIDMGDNATVGNYGIAIKAARQPAVAIETSISPDYLVCLEDGKPVKMLRRYLKRMYNMTPEEYRRKWGLPPDYPMVAQNYSVRRSALAKQNGLGKSRVASR